MRKVDPWSRLPSCAHARYPFVMGESVKKLATYSDIEAAPSHLVAELIHGVLVTSPRPASPHARAASRIGISVGGPFDFDKKGPGGWLILYEPELHLGHNVLVPDIAGWRRERMPEMPHTAGFQLAPDWLCEVLSPSTAATDRTDKLPLYANARVTHVWLMDPLARTLEVLRLDGANYRLVHTWRDDAVVRAEPFDAIELELAAFWER
jgi:Uma2 family endonuclease